MANCGSIYAGGLGSCDARMQEVTGAIIAVKGTKYTDAELKTIAKTKTYLALAAGIVAIYVPLSGFTQTTEAPKIETASSGIKGIYDDSIPSFTMFMDRGFEDWKLYWLMNNSVVDVYYITKNGIFLATTSSTQGSYSGFRSSIYAPIGLPDFTKPTEAHPIHVFSKSVEQFKNMVAIPMTFTQFDIEDIVPVGLDLYATGAYGTPSSGILTKAVLRGSDTGKAGLTTWSIIDSNVASPAVTGTDSGGGIYSLVITKASSPVALAAGDWVDVQAHLLASTFATYITTVLRVYGV